VHRAADAGIRVRRAAFVEAVIDRFPILPIDLPVARTHARLWADLASAGCLIGAHDLWLAASCIVHGLALVTANRREFERVSGLELEVWI
jgi:predicted nucleic acid-binding protein